MNDIPNPIDENEQVEGLPQAGEEDFVQVENEIVQAHKNWGRAIDNQTGQEGKVAELTQSLYIETDSNYELFHALDQSLMESSMTADSYYRRISEKFDVEKLQGWSLWLFSHHYSELLAIEGDEEQAKKWNKIAYEFNSPNKVCIGLYYYLNGMKEELEQFIKVNSDDYQTQSLLTQIQVIEKNRRKKTGRIFEDETVAETYDEDPFTNFMFQEEYPHMTEMLDIQPRDDVLDIGCGTGKYIGLMQQHNLNSITGIDISQSMIDQAKQKYKDVENLSFKQANIENRLPFPNNSFDKINCAHVLKFVTSQEGLEHVFSEIHRVLKPGGNFVFSNNHPERNFDRENFVLKTNSQETEEEGEMSQMRLHRMSDYKKASQVSGLQQDQVRDVCISKRTAQLFEPESFEKVEGGKVIIAMKFTKK